MIEDGDCALRFSSFQQPLSCHDSWHDQTDGQTNFHPDHRSGIGPSVLDLDIEQRNKPMRLAVESTWIGSGDMILALDRFVSASHITRHNFIPKALRQDDAMECAVLHDPGHLDAAGHLGLPGMAFGLIKLNEREFSQTAPCHQ